ncbi:MAG TPA: mechanosensitive ion channel domain-containing protein [Gemmatimonadaceae bacterium]|nr:mechanosensitive ion channel domain-containing protein [Gemmatimonadaceae bacterium]
MTDREARREPPLAEPQEDSAGAEDEASPQEVAQALRNVSPAERRARRPIASRHLVRVGTYFLVFAVATALFYLIRLDVLPLTDRFQALAQRLARGVMFVALVLLAGAALEAYLLAILEDDVSRYNVRRIIHFVEGLVIAFIVISVLFVNWYAAAVSLGIISAILGFALQTPLSSFIGWLYILIKQPYRVGDRIQIGDATGDVIDVDYLDTTLWEFGGPYLSTDQPSGRLIRFPNANVLHEAVYNYSWPLFPYIWNEIYVQIGYGSDLRFVADTMVRMADEELGGTMAKRVETYRALLARTAVDELEVQSRPVVFFRVSQNTWVEAVVRYLVSPRRAARLRSRLTSRILGALDAAEPGRVLFPKGDAR